MNKWQKDGMLVEFLRNLNTFQQSLLDDFKRYYANHNFLFKDKKYSLDDYHKFCCAFALENLGSYLFLDEELNLYFKVYGYKINNFSDFKHAKYTILYCRALANYKLIIDYLKILKVVGGHLI